MMEIPQTMWESQPTSYLTSVCLTLVRSKNTCKIEAWQSLDDRKSGYTFGLPAPAALLTLFGSILVVEKDVLLLKPMLSFI